MLINAEEAKHIFSTAAFNASREIVKMRERLSNPQITEASIDFCLARMETKKLSIISAYEEIEKINNEGFL